MFNKVLVPLDGSELAEGSLGPALRIVHRPGGQIILLHVPVFRPIMVPGTAGYGLVLPEQTFDLKSRDEIGHYLAEIKGARQEPDISITIEVMEGDVAGNIVDLAVDEGVDLIVMTTHGYSGFTRWMLGSITERVLRHAPCPVLVVRCADTLKHVLITLDGSRLAEQALEPGLEVARQLGGRVTLLRVADGSGLGPVEKGMLDVAHHGLSQQIDPEPGGEVHYLENLAGHYRTPGLEIDTAVVTGSPAQSILEYVEANQVDLIVMATHGRTGIRRWVYGSVTEKCLHNSACAMLIVRPPKEKS
jgi:nucleotide-binding universal stress UspA family protein